MALIPTVASTDALKIISMEINPLTGTRVQRALIKGHMGADRQPLTNEHVCESPSPLSGVVVALQPQRRDSRRCCWPAA
jgi:hypothetical protein